MRQCCQRPAAAGLGRWRWVRPCQRLQGAGAAGEVLLQQRDGFESGIALQGLVGERAVAGEVANDGSGMTRSPHEPQKNTEFRGTNS